MSDSAQSKDLKDLKDPKDLPSKPEQQFWQTVVSDLPRMLIINLICTVVVTYVMHISAGLWESFVFSNCIGFSCYFLMRSVSWLIWGCQNPRNLWFYLLCITLAPIGVMVGSIIAALLFGYSLPSLIAFQWRFSQGFFILSCLVSLVAAWIFKSQATVAQLQAESETEKARSAAIERQALQTQLQLLQAQIEPHMLFNTLANLQGLIKLDPDRAQYMLAQLITYLRATLSIARNSHSTLAQEFELIRAYLELLAIRMGARLSYTLELPAELQTLNLPPMLLQPLVENAIKHGLEPKIDGGHLTVTARLDGKHVCLQVSDTGLGLDYAGSTSNPADSLHGSSGVGNQNLRERLQALFGSQASFELRAGPEGGALAEIRLPLPADSPN